MKRKAVNMILVVLLVVAVGACVVLAVNKGSLFPQPTATPEPTIEATAEPTTEPTKPAETAITKAEVQNFFKDKLASELLYNMTSFDKEFTYEKIGNSKVLELILTSKYASFEEQMTYSEFKKLAKTYFGKTFADRDIEKVASDIMSSKDEGIDGLVAVKDTKRLYISGIGSIGSMKSVDSVKMINKDTAQVSCSLYWGDDIIKHVYTVKFSKNGSQLFFKSVKQK